MDENDLREDRDLWKQSEETCSRQYDKLLAEHSALRQHAERLIQTLENIVSCFEAARFEGLVEQLSAFDAEHGNLIDLFKRRIAYAELYAAEALASYRADYPKDDA